MQDPFLIYEGISGSIVSFIIRNSSGATFPITADCMDSVCENMVPVGRDSVCQSASGAISVSAVNRLGQGPASQPITVGQCPFISTYMYMHTKCTCACVYVSMCVCT